VKEGNKMVFGSYNREDALFRSSGIAEAFCEGHRRKRGGQRSQNSEIWNQARENLWLLINGISMKKIMEIDINRDRGFHNVKREMRILLESNGFDNENVLNWYLYDGELNISNIQKGFKKKKDIQLTDYLKLICGEISQEEYKKIENPTI
jgi:hypothetical protein